MTLYKWSKTAASNATADSTINWAEGQAPSSVNDSARATMAAIAKLRDDTNGSLAAGGTANALTITSNQVFDTLANMNGARLTFVPISVNTGATTLNVDGLGAKPLRSVQGVNLEAGTLQASVPITATYYNANGEWIIHASAAVPANQVPLGAVLPYAGATAPNANFLMCNGQAISRTTYAGLFALLSTTYGAGDTSTTFNVPDLRGRVPAGNDTMGNGAASRLTSTYFGANGSTTGAVGGGESLTIATANLPSHTHTGTTGINSADHTHTYSGTSSGASVGHTHGLTAASAVSGGAHTHGLTGGAVASHTHALTAASAASGGAHTHTVTDAGHLHDLGDGFDTESHTAFNVSGGSTTLVTAVNNSAGGKNTASATTGVSIDSGGAHTHTLSGSTDATAPSLTGTADSGGAHTHTLSGNTDGMSADHTHTYSGTSSGVSANHTHAFTSDATGNGTPSAIVQPTIILNYIIRAL